ncbi:MAG TPA: hypothetical protein VF592_03575 [Sphingomonas sp.]|jgi:hypothetical protein|uniref:hypothetical protein n=1 Tax=Sphingomonas sp. TaxID=28214 RepID=UPI002EDAEEB8
MSPDAQDTWFEAARLALADLPVDLLKRGAQHAMRHADHPAKIVALIVKDTAGLLEDRRRPVGSKIWEGADNAPRALPAPGGERGTATELDAICKRFAVGRYAREQSGRGSGPTPMGLNPERSCRTPARDDYIRMGVDPAVLDKLAAADSGKNGEAA